MKNLDIKNQEIVAMQHVDKALIYEFGTITGDDQWIHLQEECPVAHGALLLSLATSKLNAMWPSLPKTETAATVVSGIRNVVFIRPVLAGSNIKFTFHIEDNDALMHEVPFSIEVIEPGTGNGRLAAGGTIELRDIEMGHR
jgi:hypothetical protein